ncbi:DUF3429 domain-containing protein [Hansschlegelia quercus]|uniref:DUF3429 domain-containing protein n=1 Tax=Hansschlegelia quercus TaxID=2528245 RepID=A0A4Q9GPC9_9HYPH|nr:DUF3429 domain-containing protein [Hansschlegelia quercus]TBN53437.1 DUF3429 domain-containing protein [Hansschlegelia quercus]
MTLIASEPVGDDSEIPELPLALGLAGLAPFIGLALCVALGAPPFWDVAPAMALLGYGATILSFLGGAHWGLALRHPNGSLRAKLYVGAMAPPLWGWAGLIVGGSIGLAMMVVGLVVHGAVDGAFATRFAAPRWYGRLRLLLAALATVSMIAAAVVVAYGG